MAYFRNLVNDDLFIRVCIAIFSLLVSCLFGLPILLGVFGGDFWSLIGFRIINVFGMEIAFGVLSAIQ